MASYLQILLKTEKQLMSDKDTFYENLKNQLDDTTKFPGDYMYKFIVPTDQNQVEQVKDLFTAGGMNGMLGTIWLIICAMVFGGAMELSLIHI